MKFTCPLPPSVNEYLGKRVSYNPITKKPYVQVYETAKAKAFKAHMKKVLQRAVKDNDWKKTDEFTYVICEIIMYSNQKKKDADNIFKCLLDSLTENEIVYDDSLILPKVTDLLIDKENPRLVVTLRESSKVGIFKDKKSFEHFLEFNCNNCTRASRNCSIIKQSKENKLRKEIEETSPDVYKCNAFKLKGKKKQWGI